MDSIEKLSAAITMVEEARSVPLSASCVVHRTELLEILDEARSSLPQDFSSAQNLLSSRDAIIEEGRHSAEQLVSMAREEVARMVEQTSIVQAARDESHRILDEART
jgi:vacuolar-type H+-ATPase subunit H